MMEQEKPDAVPRGVEELNAILEVLPAGMSLFVPDKWADVAIGFNIKERDIWARSTAAYWLCDGKRCEIDGVAGYLFTSAAAPPP